MKMICYLQEKYHLRLKVIEGGFRTSSNGSSRQNEARAVVNGSSRRQSLGGAEAFSKISSNGFSSKKIHSSHIRSSFASGSSTVLRHAKGTSKSFDGGTRSFDRSKSMSNSIPRYSLNKSSDANEESVANGNGNENSEDKLSGISNVDTEDTVSGLLYDILQKEVINLRKACHEKDQSLNDKDDAIEVIYLEFNLHIYFLLWKVLSHLIVHYIFLT